MAASAYVRVAGPATGVSGGGGAVCVVTELVCGYGVCVAGVLVTASQDSGDGGGSRGGSIS